MIENRVTRLTVSPVGEPIFSEHCFHVEIDDDAGGEFVVVRSNMSGDGKIPIDRKDWPMLRAAIDRMLEECRA